MDNELSKEMPTPKEEAIVLNDKLISQEELEEQQKRKDIRIIQEGPGKYRKLQKLNG